MLQLLLAMWGELRRSEPLRGHSNIQGATDMAACLDSNAGLSESAESGGWKLLRLDEADLRRNHRSREIGTRSILREHAEVCGKYDEGVLRRWGDEAKRLAYDYLPKVDRNYSWVQMWDNMYNGIVKGIFAYWNEWCGDWAGHQKEYWKR